MNIKNATKLWQDGETLSNSGSFHDALLKFLAARTNLVSLDPNNPSSQAQVVLNQVLFLVKDWISNVLSTHNLVSVIIQYR